jgi:hypothetical protein
VAVLGRRLDGSILTVTETRHSVGNQLELVNDRKQNNVPMSVIIAFFTLFKSKQNNKVIFICSINDGRNGFNLFEMIK